MPSDLTYEYAVENREKVLITGKLFKADVFITRWQGTRYVVKDFSQKPFLERNLVGRIVIGREARAYAALSGVKGLPERFHRISASSIAVEYLEGTDLGVLVRGGVGTAVVREFERIVAALHERGWVHLDLHRRTNILLVDGRVYVVDLASALHTGSVPLIGPLLTRLFGLADRLSLLKMKTVFAPELLRPRDLRLLRIRNLVMPKKWKVE